MPSQERLWIVSELYYPEQTSTGYFLTRIAEGLSEDYDVHVICGRPTYSERGVAVSRKEERHGTTIHRMFSTHFDKDRLVLRAINAITLTVSAVLFFFLWARRGDRILIVTNPPMLPPLIGLLARVKGIRSALLVHDVYPEILAVTGLLDKNSLFYRGLARFMTGTYRLFDRIIVLGRDMSALVGKRMGDGDARIRIIPNWGDTDEVVPLDWQQNPFAQRHGLTRKTVVQFSGNIGRTHDIETILAAAERLKDRSDLVFLFVGYGGKTRVIEEAIAKKGLTNLVFLPRQPRPMLGPMLACSSATVIAFEEAMWGLSVPSRMYNVMAAAVPIIAAADPGSELSLTVQEAGAGWVIRPGDAETLTALIAQIDTPEGRAEAVRRGARGRRAVDPDFTLPRVLDLYRSVLGEMANGKNATAPTLLARPDQRMGD